LVRGVRVVPPAAWSLWNAPFRVIALVLVVDVTAVLLVLGSVQLGGVDRVDLMRFAALALGSVIHLDTTRTIERMREAVAVGSGTTYANLKAMWIFAGLFVLPPVLIALLIAVSYGYSWVRVITRVRAHRWVYSSSTVVLASAGGWAVLDLTGQTTDALPTGWLGLLAVLGAAAVYVAVNLGLVVAAIVLSDPSSTLRAAAGDRTHQFVVIAGFGLGIALAAMILHAPWLIGLMMVTVLVLHHVFLLPHLRAAARTDGKTGLLNATFWHEMATKELAAAKRTGRAVGLLMVDIDHFKALNDRYGHLAGDVVLRTVAAAIRDETRSYDLAGRFGGEEFVLLMPDTGIAVVRGVAERIRERIIEESVSTLTLDGAVSDISGITVSVGVAAYPHDALDLDRLLLAADNALFAAKEAGRNRVR